MLLRPKGRSRRHLAVALHGPRFLPALWDPLPQLPLCFRDLSCCSSWGGKHIFRFNTRSALALSMYTRQFRFMSIWIKEKEKKKRKNFLKCLQKVWKASWFIVWAAGSLWSTSLDSQPWNHDTSLPICLLPHCLVCVNTYGMKGMTKKNVSQVGKSTFVPTVNVKHLQNLSLFIFLVGCCFSVSSL